MASSERAGLATPPPEPNSFNIVTHYNSLIDADHSITPPIAAIESLLTLLSTSQLTTISETLNLLAAASRTLLDSLANPIPVSAGTELLQRYLLTSFQASPITAQSGSDFTLLRRQLVNNSKLFVSRTKTARSKIARYALPFIRDGSTVISYSASRVIESVLYHAAEQNRDFKVILIMPDESSVASHDGTATTGSVRANRSKDIAGHLRTLSVPTATIPLSALSHALSSLPRDHSSNTLFLLGADAILENGAPLASQGTRLVAEIAKFRGLECYFAAESYKFARQFPLTYGDRDLAFMGAKQEVLRFEVGPTATEETKVDEAANRVGLGEEKEFDFSVGVQSQLQSQSQSSSQTKSHPQEQVDITPPELVTGLITEEGVMGLQGVSEELIKLWF